MSGACATITPPDAKVNEVGIFNPSTKIVVLSDCPSPSVSSKILILSLPLRLVIISFG